MEKRVIKFSPPDISELEIEEVVKAIRASGDEFFESLKEDFEMAETKGY